METEDRARRRTPGIKKTIEGIRDVRLLVEAEVGLRALVGANECRRRGQIERGRLGVEQVFTMIRCFEFDETRGRSVVTLEAGVGLASITSIFYAETPFLLPSTFLSYIYTVHNPLETVRTLTTQNEAEARSHLTTRFYSLKITSLQLEEATLRTAFQTSSTLILQKLNPRNSGFTGEFAVYDEGRRGILSLVAEDFCKLGVRRRDRRELEDEEHPLREVIESEQIVRVQKLLREEGKEKRVTSIFDIPTREAKNRIYHQGSESVEWRKLKLRITGLIWSATWCAAIERVRVEERTQREWVVHASELRFVEKYVDFNKKWIEITSSDREKEPERHFLSQYEAAGRREVTNVEASAADRLLDQKIRFKNFINGLKKSVFDEIDGEAWGRVGLEVAEASSRESVVGHCVGCKARLDNLENLKKIQIDEWKVRTTLGREATAVYVGMLHTGLLCPVVEYLEDTARVEVEHHEDASINEITGFWYKTMEKTTRDEGRIAELVWYEKVSREQVVGWGVVRGDFLQYLFENLQKKWGTHWENILRGKTTLFAVEESTERISIHTARTITVLNNHNQFTSGCEVLLRNGIEREEATSRCAFYGAALHATEAWNRHVISAYEAFYTAEITTWALLLSEASHRSVASMQEQAEFDGFQPKSDSPVTLSRLSSMVRSSSQSGVVPGLDILWEVGGKQQQQQQQQPSPVTLKKFSVLVKRSESQGGVVPGLDLLCEVGRQQQQQQQQQQPSPVTLEEFSTLVKRSASQGGVVPGLDLLFELGEEGSEDAVKLSRLSSLIRKSSQADMVPGLDLLREAGDDRNQDAVTLGRLSSLVRRSSQADMVPGLDLLCEASKGSCNVEGLHLVKISATEAQQEDEAVTLGRLSSLIRKSSQADMVPGLDLLCETGGCDNEGLGLVRRASSSSAVVTLGRLSSLVRRSSQAGMVPGLGLLSEVEEEAATLGRLSSLIKKSSQADMVLGLEGRLCSDQEDAVASTEGRHPVGAPVEVREDLEIRDLQRVGKGCLGRGVAAAVKLRYITKMQSWWRLVMSKRTAQRLTLSRSPLRSRPLPHPPLNVPYPAQLDHPPRLLPYHHRSITRRESNLRDGIEILYMQSITRLGDYASALPS